MKKVLFTGRGLCAVFSALVLAAMLLELPPLSHLNGWVNQGFWHIRAREPSRDVVLVEIDDQSVRSLGAWPWPRTIVARMTEQLSAYGARVIGLNLLYKALDRNPALNEIRHLREELQDLDGKQRTGSVEQVRKSLLEAEHRVDGDRLLVSAIRNAQNIVLPVSFELGEPEGRLAASPRWVERNSVFVLKDRSAPRALATRGQNPLEPSLEGYVTAMEMATPFLDLVQSGVAVGQFTPLPGRDEVVRQEALLVFFSEKAFPSFALQMALSYNGTPRTSQGLPLQPLDDGGLGHGNLRAPASRYYRKLLDYGARPADLQRYSFDDVLEGRVPSERFRDKAVLVGVTARREAPRYKTPLGADYSETELLAVSLENMIAGRHMVRPWWAWAMEAGVLLFFSAFLVLILPRLPLRAGGIVTALFLGAWAALTVFLFGVFGLWLEPAGPILVVVGGYLLLAWRGVLGDRSVRQENEEAHRRLALSLQSQGLLDLAFDTFLKCSVRDEHTRSLLYNLGLDFERKRMPGKAISVYEHILKAGRYKDCRDRIESLRGSEHPAGGSLASDKTVVLKHSAVRSTLGRYEVVREIGQGAMGTVYLGLDPKINREVAIKAIRYADIDESQVTEVKTRFFREAEAAGRLNHPNIVTVHDVGEDHDMAYIAMELLKGGDLSRYCRNGHRLPLEEALHVIHGVASALEYAHRNDVIHRDIKPENIMFADGHQVKVTDFGIARVIDTASTHTGAIVGTPNYMSPEQVAGKKVDGRSDLFSLGVVFYELLTGEKPFQGENMAALMYNISNGRYTPVRKLAPKTPRCCTAIVSKLLDKAVSRRHRNAADLIRDLESCLVKVT